MVDLLVSFIMLQSRPNTLTWPRGCYRSATGWMRRISNKFTAALIKCSSCSITQDGRTPFHLALISNNNPVLDVFLSGDMEDAPPGLLHDAIALCETNIFAKKYKHLFNLDKVWLRQLYWIKPCNNDSLLGWRDSSVFGFGKMGLCYC